MKPLKIVQICAVSYESDFEVIGLDADGNVWGLSANEPEPMNQGVSDAGIGRLFTFLVGSTTFQAVQTVKRQKAYCFEATLTNDEGRERTFEFWLPRVMVTLQDGKAQISTTFDIDKHRVLPDILQFLGANSGTDEFGQEQAEDFPPKANFSDDDIPF